MVPHPFQCQPTSRRTNDPPLWGTQGKGTKHARRKRMSVTMVTTRKGGARDAMIAATRKLKAVVEKHGAESVTLNQVTVGPDAGHWVILILCANWEAFGKVTQSVMSDPAAHDALTGVDAISEVVNRRLVASVDL